MFSVLWVLINPPVAGIKGEIKVAGTNVPISAATISVQIEGEVAIDIQIDEDGSYSHQLGAGKYSILVNATDYAPQTNEFELKSDGYKTLDFILAGE